MTTLAGERPKNVVGSIGDGKPAASRIVGATSIT
jgi:hypothetical protein